MNSGATSGSGSIQTSGGPPLRAAAATAKAGAAQARLDEPRRPGREPDGRQGRRLGRRQVRHLRRSSLGDKLFNATISPLTLAPGVGIAKPVEPVQGRRHERAARRHPGQGHRQVHLRAQHPGARGCSTAAWCGRAGRAPYGTRREDRLASTRARSSTSRARRSSARATSSPSSRRTEYDAIQAAAQLKVKWKDEPRLPSTGQPVEADAGAGHGRQGPGAPRSRTRATSTPRSTRRRRPCLADLHVRTTTATR